MYCQPTGGIISLLLMLSKNLFDGDQPLWMKCCNSQCTDFSGLLCNMKMYSHCNKPSCIHIIMYLKESAQNQHFLSTFKWNTFSSFWITISFFNQTFFKPFHCHIFRYHILIHSSATINFIYTNSRRSGLSAKWKWTTPIWQLFT